MATLSSFEDYIHAHEHVRVDGDDAVGFVTATCMNPTGTVLHIRFQLGVRDFETAVSASNLTGVALSSQMRIMTMDNALTLWTFMGRHGRQAT